MREVLMRLTQEQLLEQPEQRGFLVPEVSEKTLSELMDLRILLECEGQTIDRTGRHRMGGTPECRPPQARTTRAKCTVTDRWRHSHLDAGRLGVSRYPAVCLPSDTLRQVHRQIYERSRQQAAAINHAGFRTATVSEHEAIRKRRSTAMWPPVRPRFITICKTFRDDFQEWLRLA
ncbi:MAG: hypothetical protein R3E89_18910 [Thiolinea sp.]